MKKENSPYFEAFRRFFAVTQEHRGLENPEVLQIPVASASSPQKARVDDGLKTGETFLTRKRRDERPQFSIRRCKNDEKFTVGPYCCYILGDGGLGVREK